jgi:hypothetical protein
MKNDGKLYQFVLGIRMSEKIARKLRKLETIINFARPI